MIELQQVCKTYLLGNSPLKALDQVSLKVKPGDYLSVMGPSGSGKSTLLNMIGLLDRPDSGRLLMNGDETTEMNEEQRAGLRRQQVGFIFQSFHLVARLTALENIELPLMLMGMPPRERHDRVMTLLERLDLAERAHHLPKQLSGGQLQRVAIARALIMRPKILLADEPTGNLDTHSGGEVIELLESFNQQGITLMIVTHDMALGSRAPRKLQIIDGRVNEVEQHRAFR